MPDDDDDKSDASGAKRHPSLDPAKNADTQGHQDDDVNDVFDFSKPQAKGHEDVFHTLLRAEELISKGQYEDAHNVLQAISKSLDSSTDPQLVARYLMKEGYISIHKTKWEEARNYLENAAAVIAPHITQGKGWEEMGKSVYVDLGQMNWRLADYPKAKFYLGKVLEISKDNEMVKGRAYLELGNVLGEEGAVDDAIFNYNKAIDILEPRKAVDDLARAYNNISDAYTKKGVHRWALTFADKAIELSKGRNDRKLAITYVTGAEALINMGELKLADEYLDLSQEALKDKPDKYTQGAILHLRGVVEMVSGHYEAAEIALQGAIEIMLETGIPFYLARDYLDIGRLYKKTGDIEKAKENLQRALDIFTKHNCHKEAVAAQEELKGL